MSVALLPRYPILIPGYEHLTPEEAADRLHQENNHTEWPPRQVVKAAQEERARAEAALTPEQRERLKLFPCALYRPWTDRARDTARARAAARMQITWPIQSPLDLEAIDRIIGDYDSTLAQDQADKDLKIGQGWVETPDEAKKREFAQHRELATAAAVSNTDDQRMSAAAIAHRNAVEDAADDHITEVPRTPIPAHQRKR